MVEINNSKKGYISWEAYSYFTYEFESFTNYPDALKWAKSRASVDAGDINVYFNGIHRETLKYPSY